MQSRGGSTFTSYDGHSCAVCNEANVLPKLHSTCQTALDHYLRCVTVSQWLSIFFVLVRTFKFARKAVHPCHALNFSAVKVYNVSDLYAVNIAFLEDVCVALLSIPENRNLTQ